MIPVCSRISPQGVALQSVRVPTVTRAPAEGSGSAKPGLLSLLAQGARKKVHPHMKAKRPCVDTGQTYLVTDSGEDHRTLLGGGSVVDIEWSDCSYSEEHLMTR